MSLVSPRIDVYCRCTTSCNLYISGGSPVCCLPETTAYICRCISFLNLTLLPTPAPEIYTSPVRYLPESTSLPVCNRLELLAPVMSHWILHVLLFISSRLVISRCVNPGASLPFKVLPPRMYVSCRNLHRHLEFHFPESVSPAGASGPGIYVSSHHLNLHSSSTPGIYVCFR